MEDGTFAGGEGAFHVGSIDCTFHMVVHWLPRLLAALPEAFKQICRGGLEARGEFRRVHVRAGLANLDERTFKVGVALLRTLVEAKGRLLQLFAEEVRLVQK